MRRKVEVPCHDGVMAGECLGVKISGRFEIA